LDFEGEGRRMKSLGRGKSLFGSFKEIRKGFEVLEGLFYPILKFSQIGGFWMVNYIN
jgi:hypothetical protein